MSKFGPKVSPGDAPALPLWIDGHAYLTMAESFLDVRGPDGSVLRRVPLCGADHVATAVDSAARAVAGWQGTAAETREAAFRSLYELLARYRSHLARLLAEEAGLDAAAAEAEMERALAAAAQPQAVGVAGTPGAVVAVVNEQSEPLATPLACLLDALLAGNAVVLKPSARAPSALLALAELMTRAGFPSGLVNLVQGDEAAVRALLTHPQVASLACLGEAAFCATVAGMGAGGAKALASGRGDSAVARWRAVLGAA